MTGWPLFVYEGDEYMDLLRLAASRNGNNAGRKSNRRQSGRNTDLECHLHGLAGEWAVADAWGYPRPRDTTYRYGKADGPGGIEVKSTDFWQDPCLIVHETSWRRAKGVHRYVLVLIKPHGDHINCELVGQITRERFDRIKRPGDEHDPPFTRCWWVGYRVLGCVKIGSPA